MTEDLGAAVRRRAGNRCEYCHLPQDAFRRPFHIEHIIAKQHGGQIELKNLALACWYCNLKKGPNLAGIDPESGNTVALFNPRTDEWADHFASECLVTGHSEHRDQGPDIHRARHRARTWDE